tara:strand:+ start:808 stop:1110 length:303 start_codon:yes stop_codon:yes gene_type:complete
MAKIIVRNSDNKVQVLVPDSSDVTLTDTECTYVKSNGIKTNAIDINSSTHTLIEGVAEPTKFFANCFTYIDGTWAILTEAVENMNKGAKLYDVPEIEVQL